VPRHRPLLILNVVGLSRGLVGADTPNIAALAGRTALHRIEPMLPAVTCAVQSTYLTGLAPRDHGIVGNGWFDRALSEVHFWKQSSHLVHGERVWETARARDGAITSANCFWWYAMYGSSDVTVTPRPMYPADGRKIPDIWTHPPELRDSLQSELGPFPLFKFWGPAAAIESSAWIAEAALRVRSRSAPTLTFVYLPHLDYPLQKLGPEHPEIADELRAVDALAGRLIEAYESDGGRVIVLSEYGIESVTEPIPINRVLRDAGLLALREERGRELLDCGASRAFAVVDHQVAHVYVRDPVDCPRVRELCQRTPGVELVLDVEGQAAMGVDHPRSGELVLVAAAGAWFSYGWWLEPRRAPDYARTVDIHRKPGYDPCELFLDPALPLVEARVAWALFKRRLGFRSLIKVIPLDDHLVRGSHGRVSDDPDLDPILIAPTLHKNGVLAATDVRDVILSELFAP